MSGPGDDQQLGWLRSVVSRIEFRNAAIPTRLEVRRRGVCGLHTSKELRDGFFISAHLQVRERDTGAAFEPVLEWEFPSYCLDAKEPALDVMDFVRRLVQEAWLHELDESMLVAGHRLYDPHKLARVKEDLRHQWSPARYGGSG